MENKISYKEFAKARQDLQEELYKLQLQLFPNQGYGLVEVYSDFNSKHPVESRINWSAIGVVDSGDAVKFAQLLTKAAELADSFKYNGFKVIYTDED
ncbi:MAG: hypothetical protein J6W04_00160 [Bacteroidales bacterium]|nr:hypothetical protein [Bacteroidales bacterium]